MGLDDYLENYILITSDLILLFAIGVVHLVFFFYIKQSDFGNIFDLLDSSPLFDFRLDNSGCGKDSHLVFHIWEGRKHRVSRNNIEILDKTEIDRINGYYFCYSHKSYKDLLYNGQILKKEEQCKGDYPQDCGIIDTLEQHLCIGAEENCPLYDVGIIGTDEPLNKDHYTYDTNADIYYNDNSYKTTDKKIIGKLILNDGQPCYLLEEKLWREFDSDEAGVEHMKCELEIFGETTDNRWIKKGDITYKKLYEILPQESKDLLFDEIKGDEYVSLYKREFLGIDKICDEKTDIRREDNDKLRKNQKMEKTLLIVEAAAILFFAIYLLFSFLCAICGICGLQKEFLYRCFFFILIIIFLLNLSCIICQSVFLRRIIDHDLSYDCSDKITNEILRIENLNNKNDIKYTAVNLGLDCFFVLFNLVAFLIIIIIDYVKWR